MLVGTLLVGVVAGAWLLARLRPLDPSGPAGEPLGAAVSVVVPARDEALQLPALLDALARSCLRADEVIVVDDSSRDGTAQVARAAGATVVHAPPPPPGWLGKPWACHLGAEAATGDLLVFLDADVIPGPDALGRLVRTHARHPDGLLSAQPFHAVGSAREHLSAVPTLVSMLASGAFAPMGDGATTVAFGPCVVVDAAAYRAVGGHAAVRGEVLEDLHLARAFCRSGRPVHARFGGAALRFRMYPTGLRPLVEGWTKNLAGGPGLAPRLATAGAVAWVAGAGAALLLGIRALLGADLGAAPAGAAGAVALFVVELAWMLRRTGTFRWWSALAAPVLVLAFLGLFARSVWARSVRREVGWRGRSIALGQGAPGR